MKKKDVISMVESYGLAVVRVVRNKHWKVWVRRSDGTESCVIFPSSTSDFRAMKNKDAQLRRVANGGPAR